MKKFLALVIVLLAAPLAAQKLPLVITCLADDDKPLEQEFCTLIFAAVEAHPGTRHADQSDREWMEKHFPGTEDTATSIRLEASPP